MFPHLSSDLPLIFLHTNPQSPPQTAKGICMPLIDFNRKSENGETCQTYTMISLQIIDLLPKDQRPQILA